MVETVFYFLGLVFFMVSLSIIPRFAISIATLRKLIFVVYYVI